MSLKKAFVFAAASMVIVVPFLMWGVPGIRSAIRRQEIPSSSGLTNSGQMDCNYSCRSNIVKLLNAYSDYDGVDMDNRKKQVRGIKNTNINTKGILIEEMLQSRINNRPAFVTAAEPPAPQSIKAQPV